MQEKLVGNTGINNKWLWKYLVCCEKKSVAMKEQHI